MNTCIESILPLDWKNVAWQKILLTFGSSSLSLFGVIFNCRKIKRLREAGIPCFSMKIVCPCSNHHTKLHT